MTWRIAVGAALYFGTLSSLAGVESPALTGLLFVIATGYAVFVAHNW